MAAFHFENHTVKRAFCSGPRHGCQVFGRSNAQRVCGLPEVLLELSLKVGVHAEQEDAKHGGSSRHAATRANEEGGIILHGCIDVNRKISQTFFIFLQPGCQASEQNFGGSVVAYRWCGECRNATMARKPEKVDVTGIMTNTRTTP